MIKDLNYISTKAQIGEGVTIESFSHVADDVVIGDGVWIGPHVTVMDGARIDRNCKIFPGAVISAEPQDLKYGGERTTVSIGENTIIREHVTVNRGTALDRGQTKVGRDCVLMAYTHIAHDCVIGNHVILANSVQMAGHVHIDHFAFVGGTTAIHQFVKIGTHAMISGGSLVRKDVPPYIIAARDPLAYAGVNSVGLRRRGYTNQKIREIQDVYRVLYLSGLNNTMALDKIRMELPPTDERDIITRFIENSTRGMIRRGAE